MKPIRSFRVLLIFGWRAKLSVVFGSRDALLGKNLHCCTYWSENFLFMVERLSLFHIIWPTIVGKQSYFGTAGGNEAHCHCS